MTPCSLWWQGGSAEEHDALLKTLLDCCQERDELSRLVRCSLLPKELDALARRFHQIGDRRRALLLDLAHPNHAAFAQVSQHEPLRFGAWSDVVKENPDEPDKAEAPDSESLLLHSLRHLMPEAEWELSRPPKTAAWLA